MSNQLKIVLVKSLICVPEKHKKIVSGLGLRKRMQQVLLNDTPEVRGMINKIPHMLKVESC